MEAEGKACNDIPEAIEQIKAYDRRHQNVDIRAAIQYLMSYGGDEVEQILLDIMAESSGRAIDPARVASRILAERDPDRDPRYLLRHFPNRKPVAGNSPLRRWMRRIYAYPTHGTHVYGLSRLRRFEPVLAYAKLLDRSWYAHRMVAAQALGDTADPAALDPLVTALVDPDKRVRRTAADAVRRLSHTTSAEAVFDHPIRQKLEATLADKAKNVALAVACALATIGDAASVQAYVANNPRSRRTFAGVLPGEIPPLLPIWPGEEAA